MTKIFGIGLIFLAGFLITQFFEMGTGIVHTAAQNMKSQIESDIKASLKKSGIPESNGIHHLDIKYRSQKAHDFLKDNQPGFHTSKEGKIWIEIEILDLPDSETPGFITQTSIFDVKTNNKISEFGQNYSFKKYDVEDKKEDRTEKSIKK